MKLSRKRLSIGETLDYSLKPISRSTVRSRYLEWRIAEGLPRRCDNPVCQLHTIDPEWNGKPLAIILDHIDGNKKNNRPSNLRYLCPNCNSQLPTNGGGNKGRIQNATNNSYRVIERDKSQPETLIVMLKGNGAKFN